jgi:hypothetical protein
MADVARWHLRTAPERLGKWSMRHLPSRTRRRLVQTLEWVGRPPTVTLGTPDPRQSEILVSRTLVTASESVRIPAREPLDAETGHYWHPRFVHNLKDVVLDPATGLAFHGDFVIAQSSSGYRPAADSAFLSSALARVTRTRVPDEVHDPVVPMGTIWNYALFLIESLPRLLLARDQCPAATPLYGSPVPAFADSIMSALGIEYRASAAPALHAESVWLCDPTPYGWPHPHDLARLRTLAEQLTAGAAHAYPERIVISREGGTRALVDEQRLVERLADVGYVPVALSTLPWVEQLAHFRAARSVVGGHGAGLANLTFMSPGTQVVEITAGSWWTPTFHHMAGIQQLRYDLVTIPAYRDAPHGTADDAWERVRGVLQLPA